MGPTVQVLPGPGKSFSAFQNDQAICRQFADQAVRDQAQGANLRGLGTAAITTVLGAGLGAAIGGGQGAAVGAAAGALGGAGLGAVRSSNAQNSIQALYDNAFVQCMYSLGNSGPEQRPDDGATPGARAADHTVTCLSFAARRLSALVQTPSAVRGISPLQRPVCTLAPAALTMPVSALKRQMWLTEADAVTP